MHGYCTWMIIITARRNYASAVLGVVILSVCPSVCHTRALWLIQRTYRRYFYTKWKGSPSFMPSKQWLVGDVPFHLKWAIEVTYPRSKIAHVVIFPPNKRNFYRFAIRSWGSVARSLCYSRATCILTPGFSHGHPSQAASIMACKLFTYDLYYHYEFDY